MVFNGRSWVASGKRRLGIVYFALVAALFASALSADPAWAQGNEGCANPTEVARFTGQEDQLTDDFPITGNTFRLRYDIEDLDNDEGGDTFAIFPREDGSGVGGFVREFDETSGSENILEGPGTFDLEIESEGFRYVVEVDDCRANNNNANNNGKNNNGKNNRDRFRDFLNAEEDLFNDEISTLEDAENDLEDEDTNGDAFDSSTDDSDDSGVSATADENGAEASTPGASASAGGDPDNQAPVRRPKGNVVDEVPTSGPLPNTGGVPVATGTVLAMVLFGAGLLAVRLVMIWRERRA